MDLEPPTGAAAKVRLVPWIYQGGRTSAYTYKMQFLTDLFSLNSIGPHIRRQIEGEKRYWGRTYCFRVRHWFDSNKQISMLGPAPSCGMKSSLLVQIPPPQKYQRGLVRV
ncbi:hypothetical protein FB45DRAFT_859936 [Roridomyces roridus]|uniref:Uncharacterized protein n=1 Tax=Roridomyces roridus TaxID=1738132 RepID=A0AAD7CL00_9AGAR|nr:hypothetical protein FB45DRAFT_859936 [Roridomyces roridus]